MARTGRELLALQEAAGLENDCIFSCPLEGNRTIITFSVLSHIESYLILSAVPVIGILLIFKTTYIFSIGSVYSDTPVPRPTHRLTVDSLNDNLGKGVDA